MNVTTAQLKNLSSLGRTHDETADVYTNRKGEAEADSELRDYENVPL